MKKVIFLNAGHSKTQPGVAIKGNKYKTELELNMAIRDALVPELESQGFQVKVVPDNKSLTESIEWINERAGNIDDGLALSLHHNCCGGEGAEAFYYGASSKSRVIARKLLKVYCKETGLKSRGVKPDTLSRVGQLGWIRKTDVWAVLLECGFVDSKADMDFITNNIYKTARGIAKGVCMVYGQEYQESEASNKEQIIKEIIELLNKL